MKQFYFPHDDNAASDKRLLKIRTEFGNAEGYGMWWMLLEHLSRNGGHINAEDAVDGGKECNALALAFALPQEYWARFIAFCIEIGLLHVKGITLYNARMVEHIKARENVSSERSEAAKRRWESQRRAYANASANDDAKGNAIGMLGEERRGEEIERRGYNIKKPTKKIVPPKKDGLDVEKKRTVLGDKETAKKFHALILDQKWCDESYAEKLFKQSKDLSPDLYEKLLRKMRVALNSAKHPSTVGLAKKIYHEIAGFVNDFGPMQNALGAKEREKRRELAEEESGKSYVDQELS